MKPQKETVIVTGGSGYIGRAVIDKLAGRFNLVSLDLKIPEDGSPAAQYLEIDLTSDESVAAVLQQVRRTHGERIASVIHLAAYFDLTGEPNPNYETVTVRGTERLLRGLQSLQVEQFVFASTMLVHAPTRPGQPIDEDWPLDPKLPYPASKVRTEALIHEQRGSIPVVFIRPAGIYDDRCHAVFLAQQIARIYERRLISHVYPGDIDTGQPFLHRDGLTDALLRLIERRRELPPELPLLLGEPETPTFRQLQTDLGQLIHGEDWETRTVPKAIAKSGTWVQEEVLEEDLFIKPWMVDIADDHYELDITRARTLLGWEPRHFLRATLPKMIAALKANPEGWYRENKLNAARVAADRLPQDREEAVEPAHDHDEAMRAHREEMHQMRLKMLWVHFLNIMLGAWLATSPFIFGTFNAETFRPIYNACRSLRSALSALSSPAI